MSNDQIPVQPLEELTTEQLLIAFRRLPRLPGGVNEREMKQLESYLEDARRRDTNNAELEAGFRSLLDKLDERDKWEVVEYDHLFTPQGEPIRPDYSIICDKWLTFGEVSSDTGDGYEYAICRRKVNE